MLFKVLFLVSLLQYAVADTPANCTFQDALGEWKIFVGPFLNPGEHDYQDKLKLKKIFNLIYPNLVTDEFGNYGHWTLIYNQGFEVQINNMKYFGFFDFKIINETHGISYCNRTQPNWYHDTLIRQWGSFRAEKVLSNEHSKIITNDSITFQLNKIKYGSQQFLVEIINNQNFGWTAFDYPEFHNKSLHDALNMAGGRKSKFIRPKSAPVTLDVLESIKFFPESFDWRNVNGINYISPVRHQDLCGSCYSFASTGMLEARYRIRSNNTLTPIFSPQDIIECSVYSQGCIGGFAYLVAGKYAEDFGMVEEKCSPYKGKDGLCSTVNQACKRYYATNYKYVGGFSGASNEPRMMLELVSNGPIVVGFEVYPDFKPYRSGVYHHVLHSEDIMFAQFGFNPFELTNHAVIIVGYGKTIDGQKFWIAKNSWGDSWGENGYFRIRRGVDECGIESISVAAEPIL